MLAKQFWCVAAFTQNKSAPTHFLLTSAAVGGQGWLLGGIVVSECFFWSMWANVLH